MASLRPVPGHYALELALPPPVTELSSSYKRQLSRAYRFYL